MTRILTLTLFVALAACSSAVAQEKGSSRFSFPGKKKTGKTRDINFNDLKFKMKKGGRYKKSMLTTKIKKLHEKPIKIRGYILPDSVYERKGFNQFVLVRDNLECCFGPGAAIYDCILVEMEKGKTADFSLRPVTVEGKFTLKPLKGPNGKHLAIYHIRGKKVK